VVEEVPPNPFHGASGKRFLGLPREAVLLDPEEGGVDVL
jgi:hypothetical protein